MQSAASATQGSAVADTDLWGRLAATSHEAAAVQNSVAAAEGHQQSPAKGQPQVGINVHQRPAADSINSTYQALATADRPLSSFAQKLDPTGSARQAGASSKAAIGRTGLYSQQPYSGAAATASTALGTVQAEQRSTTDGMCASATCGSPVPELSELSSLQQEGYTAEPSSEATFALISPQSGRPQAPSKNDVQQSWRSDASPDHPLAQKLAIADFAQQPAVSPGGNNSQADASYGQHVGPRHDAGHVAKAPGEAATGTHLPASAALYSPELANTGIHQAEASATIAAAKAGGAGGTADTASPSSFGCTLLGQSMDLSKVNAACSLLESSAELQHSLCATASC